MAKLTGQTYTDAEREAIASEALAESLVAKSTTIRGKTVVRHDPDKLLDVLDRLETRRQGGIKTVLSRHART